MPPRKFKLAHKNGRSGVEANVRFPRCLNMKKTRMVACAPDGGLGGHRTARAGDARHPRALGVF
eukprot:5534426-Pyramimonas_sp.AAC.1